MTKSSLIHERDALAGRPRHDQSVRKRLADEREVPAYVIFGDKTLRQLAREYPTREQDLRGVFGMGEKKREEFGSTFARFIEQFLETNPRQRFND